MTQLEGVRLKAIKSRTNMDHLSTRVIDLVRIKSFVRFVFECAGRLSEVTQARC